MEKKNSKKICPRFFHTVKYYQKNAQSVKYNIIITLHRGEVVYRN